MLEISKYIEGITQNIFNFLNTNFKIENISPYVSIVSKYSGEHTMGKSTNINLIPFTPAHVLDKELVIRMLQFEDQYGKSEEGQQYYKTELLQPQTTLNAIYATHRYVLNHFGFTTDDECVETYRTIFRTYYRSPTDYDVDVISSVFYMRGNKCVFYTRPKLTVGNKLVNCNLLNLDGSSTTLFDAVNSQQFTYCFVGAFSKS